MLKKLLAEYIGTYVLIFAGTGAIISNELSNGKVTSLGISLVFGLAVMMMIICFGRISGAHINPAVTIGFYAYKRMEGRLAIFYILSQLLGAITASLSLKTIFPDAISLGETLPANSNMQSFVLEMVLTFILMLVIISVSTGRKENDILASIAIGGVVTFGAIFGGPICGASMNPARSIGPALVNSNCSTIWIYILAPIIGALIAVIVSMILENLDCKSDVVINN